jgi:hypothetical protein
MLPGRLDAAKRAAAAISAPHIDAAKRAAAPVWEVTKLTAARQLQAMPGRIDAAQRGAHRIWLSLPRSWPELQTLVTVQLPVLIAAAPAAAADLPRRLRAWGARQWVLAALAAVAIMSVMLLLRLPPFDGGGAVGGRFGRRSSDWMPSALGGSATSLLPPGLAADPVTAQIAADLAPWADPSESRQQQCGCACLRRPPRSDMTALSPFTPLPSPCVRCRWRKRWRHPVARYRRLAAGANRTDEADAQETACAPLSGCTWSATCPSAAV